MDPGCEAILGGNDKAGFMSTPQYTPSRVKNEVITHLKVFSWVSMHLKNDVYLHVESVVFQVKLGFPVT